MARWTAYEEEKLHDLFVVQGKSYAQCGEALGKNPKTVQSKCTRMGLQALKKLGGDMQSLPAPTESDGEIIAKKSSTLADDFVDEVQRRAGAATSTGFDLFESMAKAGDLDGAETAIKIAERASKMARAAHGLDRDDKAKGEQKAFNVFFAKGVEIKKVEGEVIDV